MTFGPPALGPGPCDHRHVSCPYHFQCEAVPEGDGYVAKKLGSLFMLPVDDRPGLSNPFAVDVDRARPHGADGTLM